MWDMTELWRSNYLDGIGWYISVGEDITYPLVNIKDENIFNEVQRICGM